MGIKTIPFSEYTAQVKRYKSKLMCMKIPPAHIKQLLYYASLGVEYSGGMDFTNHVNSCNIKSFKGKRNESIHYADVDYELKFHTHVSYRIDRNVASKFPSPDDLHNITLFIPGIVVYYPENNKPTFTLMLSANTFYVSRARTYKIYETAIDDSGGTNVSAAFINRYRKAMNAIGIDFVQFNPATTSIYMVLDND